MATSRPRTSVLAAAVALAAAVTLASGPPSRAEDLPPTWGDLSSQTAFLSVVGRVDGPMAHRPGNQHVFTAITREEEVLTGQVLDWRCPAGVTAPLGYSDATTCENKGLSSLDLDHDAYSAGAPLVIRWSPRLRYMVLRSPATLTEEYVTSPRVRHGTVSIRARATGTLHLDLFPDDYYSWLTRDRARVVGGTFLGTPWLSMDSVVVTDDLLGLASYYDAAQP